MFHEYSITITIYNIGLFFAILEFLKADQYCILCIPKS